MSMCGCCGDQGVLEEMCLFVCFGVVLFLAPGVHRSMALQCQACASGSDEDKDSGETVRVC